MTAFSYRLLRYKDWPVFVFLAIVLCLFAVDGCAAETRSQAMLYPQHQTMPLLPFLDYYIDETLSMDIEEVSSPARESAFKALNLDELPRTEGIVWLRFVLAPLPGEARSPVYLLDMGQSVPGVPRLYEPARNELSGAIEWRENTPAQRNILLLPEQETIPLTCYIRIDGLPGPWFSPIIRSPQDAAGNWSSLCRTGAILALAVVMLLCLMRGLSENGQWRIWTSLYVGVALWQSLAGMPSATDNFSVWGLASILLPGIGLMLLPHVGRHLMHTPRLSKSIDIQLILLSLPGAVLALMPLVPGWDWLDRWLDTWPVGTILFVPTALGAWIMGLPGSRRFLLGCLIPPIFVAVAILGLEFGFPPNLLSSLPLWGVAFSAMLIAATKTPALAGEETKSEKQRGKKVSPAVISENADDGIINLEHPLDDPNLRLVETGMGDAENTVPGEGKIVQGAYEEPVAIKEPFGEMGSNEALELALREPLDEIMREGAAMGECSLPPAVRSYAEKMIGAAQRIADIISGSASTHVSHKEVTRPAEYFNLQTVMRAAHDAVAPAAENAGISLSWYMPPTICQHYAGNGPRLEETLRLLLESAVRSTNGGIVKFAAKDVSENGEAGHILFTITDNGHGYPPRDRSSLAMSRAWEMAGEYGGSAAMDAGPNGARVAFSAYFTPIGVKEQAKSEPDRENIVLACDDPSLRRELVRALEELPCHVCEAPGLEEAIECQRAKPGSLLIAGGNLARPASADMVGEFTRMALDAGFKHCHVLAITADDSQWPLLKPSGFTHAMLAPVEPDVLRGTVADLLSSAASTDESQLEESVLPPPGEQKMEQPAEEPVAGPIPLPAVADAKVGLTENIKIVDQQAAAPLQNQEREPEIVHKDTIQVYNSLTNGEPIAMGPVPDDVPEESGKKTKKAVMADFASGFEGPAWLGLEDEYNDEEAGQSVPVQIEKPAEIVTDAQSEIPQENENSGEQLQRVQVTSQSQHPAPGIPANTTSDFQPAEEWVGQPIPIMPMKDQGAKDDSGTAVSGDASLVDFIVGVKEGQNNRPPEMPLSSYAEAKDNARMAIEATKKNSAVSSFVNSSVELVAKTFTTALNNKRLVEKANAELTDAAMVRKAASPAERPGQLKTSDVEIKSTSEAGMPDVRSDPAIISLVETLDRAIAEAMNAYKIGNDQKVAEAAAIIVRESQTFGLRLLGRMAQCVERAARAPDHNALGDLLPELSNAVERNRITITQKK